MKFISYYHYWFTWINKWKYIACNVRLEILKGRYENNIYKLTLQSLERKSFERERERERVLFLAKPTVMKILSSFFRSHVYVRFPIYHQRTCFWLKRKGTFDNISLLRTMFHDAISIKYFQQRRNNDFN